MTLNLANAKDAHDNASSEFNEAKSKLEELIKEVDRLQATEKESKDKIF